jgi:hypothetical protein
MARLARAEVFAADEVAIMSTPLVARFADATFWE